MYTSPSEGSGGLSRRKAEPFPSSSTTPSATLASPSFALSVPDDRVRFARPRPRSPWDSRARAGSSGSSMPSDSSRSPEPLGSADVERVRRLLAAGARAPRRRLRPGAGSSSEISSAAVPARASPSRSSKSSSGASAAVGSLPRIESISSAFRSRRNPSSPSWSAIACRSASGLASSSGRSSTAMSCSLVLWGGWRPGALDSAGHPLQV